MKPFYLDWQFWSAISAIIAIILSQLPPIYTWFKGKKLRFEKTNAITLNHKIGNPNLGLFVNLKNIGGQTLAINRIRATVKVDGNNEFELSLATYLKNTTDPFYTLLTPFELKRGESWGHSICLNEQWNRKDKQTYRVLESNIRKHISDEIRVNPPKNGELYEASLEDQDKISKFFNENFKWRAGEYSIIIHVFGSNEELLLADEFNYVLFESEEKELLAYSDEYKHGAGVYYNSQNQHGLLIECT